MTLPDLDALVARLNLCGKGERLAVPELCAEAAAAITELRAEVARLKQWQVDMVAKAADKSLDGYRELGAKCAALEAERDALKQDAARYRWLREKLVYQKSGPHYGWTLDELIPGDERDAAIDAARKP